MSYDIDTALRAKGLSKSDLAELLSVHKSQITRWTKWAMPIPAKHIATVSRVTGIPRHELRPDLYAQPTRAA